jgi:predicted hotdog family 3-hydroxylacyl-ACP dehydratase
MIGKLVPHAGRMCLLERVLEHSAQHIRCATRSHRDTGNPLRRDGRLAALHLVEYAAQAAAAHGALDSGAARGGMLAAIRDVHLHVRFVEDIEAELLVEATRRLAQPDGQLYDFRVLAGDRVLCEGRLAIALS